MSCRLKNPQGWKRKSEAVLNPGLQVSLSTCLHECLYFLGIRSWRVQVGIWGKGVVIWASPPELPQHQMNPTYVDMLWPLIYCLLPFLGGGGGSFTRAGSWFDLANRVDIWGVGDRNQIPSFTRAKHKLYHWATSSLGRDCSWVEERRGSFQERKSAGLHMCSDLFCNGTRALCLSLGSSFHFISTNWQMSFPWLGHWRQRSSSQRQFYIPCKFSLNLFSKTT